MLSFVLRLAYLLLPNCNSHPSPDGDLREAVLHGQIKDDNHEHERLHDQNRQTANDLHVQRWLPQSTGRNVSAALDLVFINEFSYMNDHICIVLLLQLGGVREGGLQRTPVPARRGRVPRLEGVGGL